MHESNAFENCGQNLSKVWDSSAFVTDNCVLNVSDLRTVVHAKGLAKNCALTTQRNKRHMM